LIDSHGKLKFTPLCTVEHASWVQAKTYGAGFTTLAQAEYLSERKTLQYLVTVALLQAGGIGGVIGSTHAMEPGSAKALETP